ncbi:MAG: MarR family transcriptional regulator, partial [Nitrososphaerota archaeon]|jgi:DNA-binding MarR family transcriptional regulator|nr:MarR family transcriptional regulator [Nitrososphaerota archaeon]
MVDYTALAVEFLGKTQLIMKDKLNKFIDEAVQGEGFVLQYISLHNGCVFPGEIGHAMSVSTARIATVLNSLEKKGLITRQIDASDRRKILVKITPEGKLLAAKNCRNAVDVLEKRFVLLGERDAKEYVRIVGRLVEIILNVPQDVAVDNAV